MTSAVEPRRVLIATLSVRAPYGTDLYTRDLALGLLRRGWLPIVYTTNIGPPAEELRRATIPVVDDIEAIGAPPDVIHGHHALETLTALARFPSVPALFVCHDSWTWHSTPPSSPRIRALVAVDRNCRDRMIFENAIPENAIRVLTNAVDLARFPRRTQLPAKPSRALVFSNQAEEHTFVAAIRAACAERDITVDVVGAAAGNAADHPEAILPGYDLIFGKARCALEGAAAGAAVIVCDARGLAGMLTTQALAAMRQLNFGARTLQGPITAETIGQELDRYDAADATLVCDRIRASAGIDLLCDQYIAIYEELCATTLVSSLNEELDGFARSLSRLTRHLYGHVGGPQGTAFRLRRAILDSAALARPVRLLHQLRKRWKL